MERNMCPAVIRDAAIDKSRLKLTYPKVSGLADRGVQQRINLAILERVYALIREQGYVQDPTKEMTGGYAVKLNDKCVLSLYFTNYAYAQGAAHGLTIANTLNVDLATGRIYELKDLFRENSGWRMRISEAIKKQIKERDISLIADFKTIEPGHKDWFMTPTDLVVFFQAYEYTPYVYGLPEFPIPYAELADIANPHGPMERFI